MAPTNARSLMKDFRASFRRKKVPSTPKIDKAEQQPKEEELAKLVELKENLGENVPSRYSDSELLAFLRARSLNVKEAEKLMTVDFNLRRFLQMDEFLQNPEMPQIILNKKYTVSGIIGFDKDGYLVRVVNVGHSDIKGFINVLSTMENFKLFLWFLENDRKLQEAENRKTGNKNKQITYILNMDNLSLTKLMDKAVLETGLLAIKLLQDHYHDVVRAAYIINAGALFSSAFKLFKPVIKEDLHQRIKVLGDNWKEELLNRIDADILPAYLGGNRVDSDNDPMCKSLIGFGGPIDESYYPTEFLQLDDPDVISVIVPSGGSLFYRFPVPAVGSIVRWDIESKENDIGIQVFLDAVVDEITQGKAKKRKDEDVSQMEPLTPYIRSQCQLCPEKGQTVAWFTGTIVLQIDNSYSWMSSKDITFKITVEPPKNGEKNHLNGTHHATKKA
ncbi:retinal-binding protein [Trichonephila inaurata madagascariensis]|uniref:Retinal-binding protein n=1 Tax=Trichonephila inaurata madagascariensis TaxID=2747483 RepID=A0A8X6YP79_9ARAC|nr:retinal-binding protein [Trichonephila inaurata madagascariensis]